MSAAGSVRSLNDLLEAVQRLARAGAPDNSRLTMHDGELFRAAAAKEGFVLEIIEASATCGAISMARCSCDGVQLIIFDDVATCEVVF